MFYSLRRVLLAHGKVRISGSAVKVWFFSCGTLKHETVIFSTILSYCMEYVINENFAQKYFAALSIHSFFTVFSIVHIVYLIKYILFSMKSYVNSY